MKTKPDSKNTTKTKLHSENNQRTPKIQNNYNATHIEVLEGLEPVRKRPGMYIGGTDNHALHHLVTELVDNAVDEALAGFGKKITITLEKNGSITVHDQGRGIPTDQHPKFKGKNTLDVLLTTLHSGGKFKQGAYHTAGGLHGVGLSVVNALAKELSVTIMRDGKQFFAQYQQGKPTKPLHTTAKSTKTGTIINFIPDDSIFQNCQFSTAKLREIAASKAYLIPELAVEWTNHDLLHPENIIFHFKNGLKDHWENYFAPQLHSQNARIGALFHHKHKTQNMQVEWTIGWTLDHDNGSCTSWCNTIPTPQGGTHEQGLKNGIIKALRAHAERTAHKKINDINADDMLGFANASLSIFIPQPQFQGQTKEKLTNTELAKTIEQHIKTTLEQQLAERLNEATTILNHATQRAENRLKRREEKKLKAKTQRPRLPGKLADCNQPDNNEIFLVEGDSAGGSAKQARDRQTQAVLPLRGKILNVASASDDRLLQNREIDDLCRALGCGRRELYDDSKRRYDRVIIMTDADVDGAHIAALLMTFFWREMKELIERKRLFLAQPPLYRIEPKRSSGQKNSQAFYALDDKQRDSIIKKHFGLKPGDNANDKIDIARFKGLGEMLPAQLRETTMSPRSRRLLQVKLPSKPDEKLKLEELVATLMGKRPEARFAWLRDHAREANEIDL